MQRPRNPRHFPRMKVRGACRRRLAPWQQMMRGLDIAVRNFGSVMKAFEQKTSKRQSSVRAD